MKDLLFEIGGSPVVVTVPDNYGEAVVNGRKWRWDWTYFGPQFVNADGSTRKQVPSENHPVWKAVAKWEKKRLNK